MSLGVQELKEMKQELKKFTNNPIQKSYKIIVQLYKSNIDTQALIDSEITKSLVRIGQKKYDDEDEEKYIKTIKVCRKLIKQWKQVIQCDESIEERKIQKRKQSDEPRIQKKPKQNKHEKHERNQNNKSETQNNSQQNGNQSEVPQSRRDQAVEGLKKYFKQQTSDEQTEWATKIEQTIFDLYKSQSNFYMDKVKGMVKQIDKNGSFRTRLLNGEFNLEEEIKNLN